VGTYLVLIFCSGMEDNLPDLCGYSEIIYFRECPFKRFVTGINSYEWWINIIIFAGI